MTNLTLKKLSQVLELSVSTVSRALKNHPDISPQTRKKVVELAHALDYEPDANAVHLRTKSTKLLGLMAPSISNYFYESFIGAVEVESRKRGYSVMILQSGDDPAIESENLRLFRQNRISGLFACITPFTEDLSHFIKMRELKIPVFFSIKSLLMTVSQRYAWPMNSPVNWPLKPFTVLTARTYWPYLATSSCRLRKKG